MKVLSISPSPSPLSDLEIVRRVLTGEKELYELLMRRNNQKLYRVIRSYIKDLEEIEDIMQNTYLKAYEKLQQFKHSSSFSTWLIRIGINIALARFKEKGKMAFIDNNYSHFEENGIVQMRKSYQKSPEELMIHHESKHLIEKTIDLIDQKYKVVFILKEIEGMSIAEISACLDLSPSNVKVRLHRAKALLKEKLMELHLKKDIFEFGNTRCDHIVSQVMEKIR